MSSKHSNYIFDVFVSYSHADRDWVWGDLIPNLKEAGLAVCTDRESFDIGVPAPINMENAVSASRHTILVLTPSWLESEWSNFEAFLVQAEDPIGIRQQTLPIMLRHCEPPRRISMLTYADLTGRVDKEAEFAKLIEAIRGLRRLSASGKDIADQPFKHEPTVERQVFNLQEPCWREFIQQIHAYRREPIKKILALFAEIERQIAQIVDSTDKPFYSTREWETFKTSLNQFHDTAPNPGEEDLKSHIIQNLSLLFENAGQQAFFLEDWEGSRTLLELTLKLAPRNARAMSALKQATEKYESLDMLKVNRYEMLQQAIRTNDEERFLQILSWFAERAPNYRDIPRVLNEHRRRLR